MLVCQDRDCGYRKSLSFLTNVRCPQCHKMLEQFGDGEKKVFICPCGFREKYEVFTKRMEENRQNMSKREVEQYLKQQRDSKPQMTAFEAAMAAMEKKDE